MGVGHVITTGSVSIYRSTLQMISHGKRNSPYVLKKPWEATNFNTNSTKPNLSNFDFNQPIPTKQLEPTNLNQPTSTNQSHKKSTLSNQHLSPPPPLVLTVPAKPGNARQPWFIVMCLFSWFHRGLYNGEYG